MTEPAISLAPEAQANQLVLPRSAVRGLAACAASDRLCPELELRDEWAASLFNQLGGSFDRFGNGELRCAAFRTSVVDELACGFFERNPNGVGVSLWPMLGTRAHRLSAHRWLELDAPPLAALRERYLPAQSSWKQLASCLCGAGKVAVSEGGAGPRLFVIDEALLPLCRDIMSRVLDSIAAYAKPGSELLVTFDGSAPLAATRSGSLELGALEPEDDLMRYPSLRFVDTSLYSEELSTAVAGFKAVAQLQGPGAPSLAHLRVL